ncbi:MAG: alpha-glucan family phosphorylase [Marinifilaceae bacterium]
MDANNNVSYLFETSWEVCNKVGGIYTVISTKAKQLTEKFDSRYILIGPDIWRSTDNNPEFTEDPKLFKAWRNKAQRDGLRVKVGHWNIAGSPIVILVEFSSYITQKDDIFAQLWEKYHLDSLSGQWDYIEPALFGVAVGKVIESFTRFHCTSRQRVVAQFHEWMTGSGILYLKATMPQIGTIFTTHATVLGRCVAGNNLPLYGDMTSYDPDLTAARFNVVSKQSLEKRSAENADCFTTVSDITAQECKHFLGKAVDIVTPNGFDDAFLPQSKELLAKGRQQARTKLLEVASACCNREVGKDALLIGISGRYEFRNKGIDVFIEALDQLKVETTKEVVAFIFVPAGICGINEELRRKIDRHYDAELSKPFVTHLLCDTTRDDIYRSISTPLPEKVTVVYVPSYLNGDDGIFNMSYYELLVGLDLTIFPSYYEPWGYTPLESLAFSVPTVTTTLAGFGLWVKYHYNVVHPGILIVERNDMNADDVANAITKRIEEQLKLDETTFEAERTNAFDVSRIALWENLIEYYFEAYMKSLSKIETRIKDIPIKQDDVSNYDKEKLQVNQPTWTTIMIHKTLPPKLAFLDTLSKNLWWCWNEEAKELFRYIDTEHWEAGDHNPITLLEHISLNRYKELEQDARFIDKLNAVERHFNEYMAEKEKMKAPNVAYFSMEFGLHTSLKVYSGGLGVLAGDYLKAASDRGANIVGVGLLYRYGYFTQVISASGDQEEVYEAQDFMRIPVSPVYDENGNWQMIQLVLPGRTVQVRIWKVAVGRVDLYLLDTDFELNSDEDKTITHHLYGGDWENRLKQELLLGCGGIRALRKLNIPLDLYHCNEGHAAFIGLERIGEYIEKQDLSFDEALEVVRASTLFTTHTPVPAGHDSFSEGMLRTYISHFCDKLQIDWERLYGLGRTSTAGPNDLFSMSFLAANLAQEINGVSKLHGDVSRKIFQPLWQGYMTDELHLGYVTNGVHYYTWTDPLWQNIQQAHFDNKDDLLSYNKNCFDKIYKTSDEDIISLRNELRRRLIRYIKQIFTKHKSTSYLTPREIVQLQETLKEDKLTIGFARRFATYKRAYLLFSNLERLNEIVNHPTRPVQFVFAGKAHPADKAGQNLIKHIIEISKYPQFVGKIVFLPNYDMDVAKKMIQGVDIWLNTPVRPQEASGTSGEKAAMNGVMHFSVLDGWWVEGYREDAGWMLPEENTYENSTFQDELDSEVIYNIIEDDIAPKFYDRNQQGISNVWASFIKNCIGHVASNFTANRMLTDYEQKYYFPMKKRFTELCNDNYSEAIEIAAWKEKVKREWPSVDFASVDIVGNYQRSFNIGEPYIGEVLLELGELSIGDVGVEMVLAKRRNQEMIFVDRFNFTPVGMEDGKAKYKIELMPTVAGIHIIALRIYPTNKLLPHRQDFPLVKWS